MSNRLRAISGISEMIDSSNSEEESESGIGEESSREGQDTIISSVPSFSM